MLRKIQTKFPKVDIALIQRFVAEGTAKTTALATTIILARAMGVSAFGQLSQIQAMVLLLVPLALLGLNFSIVRQLASLTKSPDISSALFTCFVLITATVSIPAGYLYWTAGTVRDLLSLDSNAELAIRVSAVLLISTTWQTLILEALRARQHAYSAMVLQLLESICSLSLIAILAFSSQLNPLAVILVFTSTKFIVFLIGVTDFIRLERIQTNNTKILLLPDIRTALIIGLPLMLASFGEALMGMSDRVLIGRELGPDALGRYVMAQTLVGLLASWGAPYWWLLYPRLAAAFDKNEAVRLVHRLSGGFVVWGTLIAAMIMLLGAFIIEATVGPAYTVDTRVLFILLFAALINQLATPWEYSLYVAGKTIALMWSTLFWGLVTLVGVFLSLPHFDLFGACLALLFARLGFAATTLWCASSIGFGLILLPAARIIHAGLGVIVALSIMLILGDNLQTPIVSGIIFAIIYIVTVRFLQHLYARRAEDA